jgi:amidohydrolase
MVAPLFIEEAAELTEELIERRRDLHRHPELGFQEHRTASIVAEVLEQLRLDVQTGVAETGVVAVLRGQSTERTALLRFDMDALPVQEETDRPYASTIPGVMHACGHDGHTAVGIAVAQLLHGRVEDLPGNVKFVFQPAEEGLGGAERMVAEGTLDNPVPDVSLAFHLWNEKPVGWIGITSGPAMAGAEILEIEIVGKGGHGAGPHLSVDPVLAAAHVTSALQSVVARNVNPLHSAVVSVTQIEAGETFNVIPERALLRGTIRTFLPEVREVVLKRVTEIADGIASAMGCSVQMKIKQLTPPVINDKKIAERLQQLSKEMFPSATIDTAETTMGSEDMAYFMDSIPGCLVFVGSSNSERGFDAPHHNPSFDFDERVLPDAAALMAAAAWRILEDA